MRRAIMAVDRDGGLDGEVDNGSGASSRLIRTVLILHTVHTNISSPTLSHRVRDDSEEEKHRSC